MVRNWSLQLFMMILFSFPTTNNIFVPMSPQWRGSLLTCLLVSEPEEISTPSHLLCSRFILSIIYALSFNWQSLMWNSSTEEGWMSSPSLSVYPRPQKSNPIWESAFWTGAVTKILWVTHQPTIYELCRTWVQWRSRACPYSLKV